MSAFVQSAEAVAQEKSFHLVSRHLVKEVISPNENVRKQVHLVETLLSITLICAATPNCSCEVQALLPGSCVGVVSFPGHFRMAWEFP